MTKRVPIQARVAEGTLKTVKGIAFTLGYEYSGEGSLGKMLDAIAAGDLAVVRPKKKEKVVDTSPDEELA